MQSFRVIHRPIAAVIIAGLGLGACSQTAQLTEPGAFCGFETVELATRAPDPGMPAVAAAMPSPSSVSAPPAPVPLEIPPPVPIPAPTIAAGPDPRSARTMPSSAQPSEPASPLAQMIEDSLTAPVRAPPPPAPLPPPPRSVTGASLPPSPSPLPAPVPMPPVQHTPDILLALSGGSENGSFGAGILSGWNGPLPEFRTVTGVSTGAILASFAFAGSKEGARLGYTIDKETQLLTPYVRPTGGSITARNFPTLLRRGSFADLVPLRDRLKHFLNDAMMERIAAGHRAKRRLYVGATNVDTGEGVAFDLGHMATRYSDTVDPAGKARWKDCYVEAIIASSSTPMAAPPVFIDNAMYIDGGSRFGMFSAPMMEVRRKRAALSGQGLIAPPPTIYAVVNGTLDMPPPKCPKENPAMCQAFPPDGGNQGKHRKWNILELALGSEKVLVNQVYRFSAQEVGQSTCDEAGCLHFMRIGADVAQFTHTLPNPENGGAPDSLTCRQWRDVDNRVDNPVQFHKRFMRCLIAYGEYRVREEGWGQ